MYKKQSPREIDLMEGESVFVKTRVIKGWVFVETLRDSCGYAPYSFLQPILVDCQKVSENNQILKNPVVNVQLRGNQRRSISNHHTMYQRVVFSCYSIEIRIHQINSLSTVEHQVEVSKPFRIPIQKTNVLFLFFLYNHPKPFNY